MSKRDWLWLGAIALGSGTVGAVLGVASVARADGLSDAGTAMASGGLTWAGTLLSDFMPLLVWPIGILAVALVGAVFFGWVRGK